LTLPKGHPKPFKDASAAAIALSGMLELRRYAAGGPSKYSVVIDQLLKTLSQTYLSEGTRSSGILLHGAYNANSANPFDWDASTIWGDYYFLEAIERLGNDHSPR
jgi:unsaturated chondroitin disaccharide hydrolase